MGTSRRELKKEMLMFILLVVFIVDKTFLILRCMYYIYIGGKYSLSLQLILGSPQRVLVTSLCYVIL